MQVKFDSDMKIFAQIGDPLEHSCTSYIHNSMYALGNVNAVNFNVVVKRGELPQFAEAAKVMHLSGFGITMPQRRISFRFWMSAMSSVGFSTA